MTDQMNQDTATAAAEEKPERTFTQSEMNAIIGKRLHEEQTKYADYETLKEKAQKYDQAEEASKTELQKATERADALQRKYDELKKANDLQAIRSKVSQETGVPASLLSGDTEEACKAQADAILEFAKPQQPAAYPVIKDGGEPRRAASGAKTRDLFAQWVNSNF